MKKIYCLIILLLLICVYSINAQNYWLAEFDYDDAPNKIVANLNSPIACELFCGAGEAHPDDPLGGFLLAGFYNNDAHSALIVRIDNDGNELWRKDLKNGSLKGSGYKAAHYTDDKNFLIGGNDGIMKINSATGAMMWSGVELPDVYGENDQVAFIKRYAPDKYLVITHGWGEAYTFNAATKSKIKGVVFDSDIKDASFKWELYDATYTTDGNFIFVGEYLGNLNVCLARESDLGFIGPIG